MIFNFRKFKKTQYKKGMTYVELIVVLSIFSIMSAVALFDYGKFEARINVRNLASDIALQIVGAQKNAMAGKLADNVVLNVSNADDWTPAYGVYFDQSRSKQFFYFADVYNDENCYGDCSTSPFYIDTLDITNGSFIKELKLVTSDDDNSDCGIAPFQEVKIIFKRPDSSAKISSEPIGFASSDVPGGCYLRIYVSSGDNSTTAKINVYPSGRIEIK